MFASLDTSYNIFGSLVSIPVQCLGPILKHLLFFPPLPKCGLSSCLWEFTIHHCTEIHFPQRSKICPFISFDINLTTTTRTIIMMMISYHRHDHCHKQLKQLLRLGTLPKIAAAFNITVINPFVNITVVVVVIIVVTIIIIVNITVAIIVVLVIISSSIITATFAKRFRWKQVPNYRLIWNPTRQTVHAVAGLIYHSILTRISTPV